MILLIRGYQLSLIVELNKYLKHCNILIQQFSKLLTLDPLRPYF